MTVGEKFRQARIKAHMTQKMVAEKLGCTIQNISRMETGKHEIKYDTMIRLSNAIGVMVEDIWSGEEIDAALPVSVQNQLKTSMDQLIEVSARISENLDSLLLDLFHQLSIVGKKDIICHAASLVDAEKAGDDSQLSAMRKIFK